MSDPDTGQSSFVAQNNVATTYGHFTLATGGGWTYTLDNSNATVDALNNGQTLTDTVTVNSADGTSHSVNITINGATDSTDLGGPTGISFNLNPTINGSNVSNLGTFVATGDPDAGDIFTWSVGAGSSSGFDVTGGVLNANSVAAGDSTLNLVVTDKAGNSFSQTYHVWIGTSAANTKTFALASNNNIGDGLAGGDSLIGGSGLDYLAGAAGDDTFQGNGGADQFVGGSGSDHFVYAASGDSTNTAFDTILDFASGTDRIDFKSALGLTNNDGNLGAATTLAAHHVGWKSVGSDAIVYANTGTASAPIASSQVMEIHLTGVSSLNANDFNLSA